MARIRRIEMAAPPRLREIVVGAVATAAELPPGDVTDDLNLFDLGLDSLNFAGILIDIEDGVGAEVPAEVLERFLEIGDTVTVRDVLSVLSTWDMDRSADDARLYDPVVVFQDGSPST
jgi:acyl carrier protein